MAKFSKFTKVSVVASLSLEEAGALVHCLNYTIARYKTTGDMGVYRNLLGIRAELLKAGVEVDGKSP